jgi:acyl-CoA synthetase (AMP-forming)/AMP-acid ligase II
LQDSDAAILHFDKRESHEYRRNNMARFMVPRCIRFVTAIVRTSVGKIDRQQFEDLAEADWDAELESAQ